MSLLSVENLSVVYGHNDNAFLAVSDVTFSIKKGQSFGLIGESGCGKTTVALAILNLLDKNAVRTKGKIYFAGQDLTKISAAEWQKLRGRQIALIPQASQHSLNPVLNIGRQMTEHLCRHKAASSKAEALSLAKDGLREVGLSEAVLSHYPHQLSGGMRQRVAIAMAYLLKPQLIIADEPTNSLDVSSQEQIIQLFNRLQKSGQISLLLISHDMGVVARTCGNISVMNHGHMIEQGSCHSLFWQPREIYTQKLLHSFWSLRKSNNVSVNC